MDIRKYLNRKWIILLIAFITVRIIIMAGYWYACRHTGGWEAAFLGYAQPTQSVLLNIFHDYCDWHPPLYYFFTSVILTLTGSLWFIYIAQNILALLALVFAYRITRLYFSERVAYLSVFIFAVEPYGAWHNFTLSSENLVTFLFIGGMYYFLKYFRDPAIKYVFYASFYLALATLTRPNTLFFAILISLAAVFAYLVKDKIPADAWSAVGWRGLLKAMLIFNASLLCVMLPWMIRNKIVYDRFTLSNIIATNPVVANIPALVAFREGISYSAGMDVIKNELDDHLGPDHVWDQGDCHKYTNEELNRQLDYYQSITKQYILSDPVRYTEMHLVRTLPFFFQSAYENMWDMAGGGYHKPDLTGAILNGNYSTVIKYFTSPSPSFFIYIFGVLFWGICSFAVFFGAVYAYFRDRKKFFFFYISALTIVYSALLISPYVLARYRLPVYVFFFVPLAYFIMDLVWPKIKK